MKRILQIVAVLVLMLAVAAGGAWWLTLPAAPDRFYAYNDPLPASRGELLRVEPLAAARIPANARGWRILYTMTRPDGTAAVASAVVVAPDAGSTTHPVVAYAHGTTGVSAECAPSLMDDPFPNVPGFPQLLEQGWAYVGTDYAGLGTGGGHFYLVGQDAGRAVLDSVVAARKIPGLALSDRTVVWGHSQGGHSALWAAQLAADYAPDVPLSGVAAISPASDLPRLVEASRHTAFGKITSAYLVAGYEAAYPGLNIRDYAGWRSRLLAGEIARRCISRPSVLGALLAVSLMPRDGMFDRSPNEGALGQRIAENVPRGPFPVPVLIGQGQTDELVLPSIQDRYAASLCNAGEKLTYLTYPGHDHISVVQTDSPLVPDLIDWTRARFAQTAFSGDCGP